MNKGKQELLDKCIKLQFDEPVPKLGGIYIIPTQYIHDSGYKIMYIIGHEPYQQGKKEKLYLLDTGCDVVDFEHFMKNKLINDLHIDINKSGIIHIWSNSQNMKNIFKLSNCTFEMENRY